jgi:hypothetical protein
MTFLIPILKFFRQIFDMICRMLKWPFGAMVGMSRRLYEKFYGPPMMMGGPPVDHSPPDMEDKDNRLPGWTLYIMIAGFFVVAMIWVVIAEIDEQVRAEGIIVTP